MLKHRLIFSNDKKRSIKKKIFNSIRKKSIIEVSSDKFNQLINHIKKKNISSKKKMIYCFILSIKF